MPVHLVCEGPRQGLDERVLDALVIELRNLPVVVEAAGGSKGHRAVRGFLESRSPHDVAIAIEDRDFLPRTEADLTWANPAGKSSIWRRHEIENYLLHPRVVLELFNDFRAAGQAWANSLPATEGDVSALLQTLATSLLEDHAAQVLKYELVQLITGVGSLTFAPPRPIAPGAHTCGQAQWVPALQKAGGDLLRTCGSVTALPDLQAAAIAARYNAHVAQFQNPGFLNSGDFLIDMKGKDLMAAFSRHLGAAAAPARLISQDVLADELLRMIVRVYQPSLLYQPDDFAELAAILRQYCP